MEPDGRPLPPLQVTEGDIGPFSAVKVPVIFSPVTPGAIQTRFKVTFDNQECPTVSVPQTLDTHGHCRVDPSWTHTGPQPARASSQDQGQLPEAPTLALLVDDRRSAPNTHTRAHSVMAPTRACARTCSHTCVHAHVRALADLARDHQLGDQRQGDSANAVCANAAGAWTPPLAVPPAW